MTTVYEPPDLTGTAITWGDEPRYHGSEYREYVYPGRRVASIPGRAWPNTPERCEIADEFQPGHRETEWLAGGNLLVCIGCGLDVT